MGTEHIISAACNRFRYLGASYVDTEFVQAMFTEPADQSVWWYHHFLLSWGEEGANSSDGKERYEKILRDEESTLAELIEVEERCKVGRWILQYPNWTRGSRVFSESRVLVTSVRHDSTRSSRRFGGQEGLARLGGVEGLNWPVGVKVCNFLTVLQYSSCISSLQGVKYLLFDESR